MICLEMYLLKNILLYATKIKNTFACIYLFCVIMRDHHSLDLGLQMNVHSICLCLFSSAESKALSGGQAW